MVAAVKHDFDRGDDYEEEYNKTPNGCLYVVVTSVLCWILFGLWVKYAG